MVDLPGPRGRGQDQHQAAALDRQVIGADWLMAHSRFWICSRNWSMTTFSSMPALVTATALDLEQTVLDSRLNSWRGNRVVCGPPARPRPEACGRPGCGRQAVELLADVGAGGNQRHFLGQPVAVKTGGCFEQRLDLAGNALADHVGLAATDRPRCGPRAGRSGRSGHRERRRACRLPAAHRHHGGCRLAETGQDVGIEGCEFLGTFPAGRGIR